MNYLVAYKINISHIIQLPNDSIENMFFGSFVNGEQIDNSEIDSKIITFDNVTINEDLISKCKEKINNEYKERYGDSYSFDITILSITELK